MMAKSLVFCGILQIPVMATLYLLGLGLFAYYHAPENAALLSSLNGLVAWTGDPNMVLPHFVRNVLPSSLAGLVFAGLFAATMSVFSSGLNSLSTATCMDFLQHRMVPLDQRRTNPTQCPMDHVCVGFAGDLGGHRRLFRPHGIALADRRLDRRLLQRAVAGNVPARNAYDAGKLPRRHPRHFLDSFRRCLVEPRVVHLVCRRGLCADLGFRLCRQPIYIYMAAAPQRRCCAAGSCDPKLDSTGPSGRRLFATSVSALTLQRTIAACRCTMAAKLPCRQTRPPTETMHNNTLPCHNSPKDENHLQCELT